MTKREQKIFAALRQKIAQAIQHYLQDKMYRQKHEDVAQSFIPVGYCLVNQHGYLLGLNDKFVDDRLCGGTMIFDSGDEAMDYLKEKRLDADTITAAHVHFMQRK